MEEKKVAPNIRYDIEIIEEDGTRRIFKSLSKANENSSRPIFFYCFAEKHKHYLTENGLSIKSIRRMYETKYVG